MGQHNLKIYSDILSVSDNSDEKVMYSPIQNAELAKSKSLIMLSQSPDSVSINILKYFPRIVVSGPPPATGPTRPRQCFDKEDAHAKFNGIYILSPILHI